MTINWSMICNWMVFGIQYNFIRFLYLSHLKISQFSPNFCHSLLHFLQLLSSACFFFKLSGLFIIVVMEDRFRSLEAQVVEQGSKIDSRLQSVEARLQSVEDTIQEFKSEMFAQFAGWKSEMTELLRQNRPPSPVIDPSSAHGRGQTSLPNQGEGSQMPGRRPGKEPAVQNDPENPEIVVEDEGLGENTHAFQIGQRVDDLDWAPRRGNLEVRQQAQGHGGDNFTSPRFITPLSLSGPSEADLQRNAELEKFLRDSGVYVKEEEAAMRKEVLCKLDQIVKRWVKQLARQGGYTDQMVEDANSIIFTCGSYRLGVHVPGTAIDTLCIGPSYVNREEDFFTILRDILAKMEEVTEIRCVLEAHVPVMKFKFQGISINLLYASISLMVVPEDLDISDCSVLYNIDETTLQSLNGCRVAGELMKLVPNVEYFQMTLRALKFWAKIHVVYSDVTGFLGGTSWAVLVAHICQLYPNAIPSMLVSRVFRVYTQWHWPNPVMLCPIEHNELSFLPWDPRKNPEEQTHRMPIITPAYPCMNSSSHVSASTLSVLMSQFQFGSEICEGIESSAAQWDALFEPYSFFEAFKDFVQVDIVAADDNDLLSWKEWVESKLVELTLKIETVTNGMMHSHPNPNAFVDSSKPHPHFAFFIGLMRNREAAKRRRVLYIRGAVEEFRREISRYTCLKPGMEISVSHVLRNQIPAFVFPEGHTIP
ncbi:PREDICTED: nuclear poly(A) polymerase 2-like isoform X2 [Ipomoea nil]|uniref:nuclear poly(A) polymerase 2-like isoform X2 n=1 Tax=Ipomoea nil TaxID=35883 RepID=UPI000901A5A6|nr:PREDICTED: nuclear poly(A) polymerase 2-like isoform X2 [Ipomoea nil]